MNVTMFAGVFALVRRSCALFALLLASLSCLFAQNREPEPLDLLDDAQYSDVLADRYNPIRNRFFLGWNWGDSPSGALSDALDMTLWHGGANDLSNSNSKGSKFIRDQVTDNMDMMWVLRSGNNRNAVSANWNSATCIQGVALHYDPTVTVQENGSFTVPTQKPDAGSFGFLTRNYGTVEQVSGQTSYVVRSNNTPVNSLILGKPWPYNLMFRLNKMDVDANEDIKNFNGTRLHLAINLRRLSSAGGNIQDNSPVLKIRAPYRIVPNGLYNPSYIRFSQLSPNTPVHSTIVASTCSPGDRGYKIEPLPVGNTITEFVITRNMLPPIVTGSNGEITLYAFMELEDPHNPELRNPDEYTSSTRITELGIDVTYMGNEDVAINWLRFQTPNAKRLFEGEYDCTIRNALASDLGYLANTTRNPHRARIYRVFGIDECRPQQFWAMRYFNKLLGGLAVTERGDDYGSHYSQIVQPREKWFGITSYQPHIHTAPYYRSGWSLWNYSTEGQQALCLGIKRGYNDHLPVYPPPPPSHYETSTYGHYVSSLSALRNLPEYGTGNFIDVCKFAGGTLLEFEYHSLYGFYKENMEHRPGNDILKDFLYSGKSWFTNIWAFSGWESVAHPDNTGQTLWKNYHHRPKTGEELRSFIWQSLVLGTKGLLYYKASNAGSNEIGFADDPNWTVNRNSGESKWDFLDSRDAPSEFGGDFIASGERNGIDQHIDWTQAAIRLGVPQNRLYLGRKSQRLEIRKIHDQIAVMEQELLPLKLKVWFGKGIKEIFSSATPNDILAFDKLIDRSPERLKIRPVNRTYGNGQNWYEPWDSMFVDITMLTHPEQNNTYYIGVFNRRTDPVVAKPAAWVPPAGNNGTYLGSVGSQVYRFYSTAEFDDMVRANMLGRYDQLGAREITLPFQYHYAGGQGEPGYALLHIEELGGGIDTVIGQNRDLAINFQPGEGKILRVTVLAPDESQDGYLAYSNQRKMVVVVPSVLGPPENPRYQKRRYHMVYDKLIPGTNRKGVYYRQSTAMRNSIDDNITWQTPILLSTRITHNGLTDQFMDCAYPSLVVRDELGAKVYVVYSCTGGDGEILQLGPEQKMAIVENMFSATSPLSDYTNATTGKVLAITEGSSDKSLWGTPVINASANGQYYAWSDRKKGMGVGFKPSNTDPPLSTIKTFSWLHGYTTPPPVYYLPECSHPALNTYSRISEGENECALVWQENNNIYYMRLKYDAGTNRIVEYPLPNFNNNWQILPTAHNNTMMRLSQENCTGFNRLPVVYRGLETPMFWNWPPNPVAGPARRDVVFWEGSPAGISTSRIYTRLLDMVDDNTTGQSYWNVYPMGSITGAVIKTFPPNITLTDLKNPDLCQGVYRPLQQPGIESANRSDSSFVVTIELSNRNQILQLPFNLFSPLLQEPGGIISYNGRPFTWSRPLQVTTKRGRLSHLAARRYLLPNDVNEWREIRRVYEYLDSPPPLLITSAEHFYKNGILDLIIASLGPGYQKDCQKLNITNVKLLKQGEQTPSELAFYIPLNTTATITPAGYSLPSIYSLPDTLRSVPFTVENSVSMTFDIIGSDTSFVRMEIVRKSDGYRQFIPLSPATDTLLSSRQILLTNGGNELYTIEFMKTHPSASYVEDTFISYDSTADTTPISKTGITSSTVFSVINLSQNRNMVATTGLSSFVYPNPATDKVHVSIYRNSGEEKHSHATPGEITIRIFSTLGQQVASYSSAVEDNIIIDTSQFPAGMYFIRVENTVGEQGNNSFVVKR